MNIFQFGQQIQIRSANAHANASKKKNTLALLSIN